MPQDGYITKKNLDEYENQLQGRRIEVDQQAGEEWQAYGKLQENTHRLRDNYRSAYFSQLPKRDSGLMQSVKIYLNEITDFYTKETMADTEEAFEQQLLDLKESYKNLKKHCEIYLEQRKGGLKRIYKGEGYQRYQLVKKALARASVEMTILENRARRVFEDTKELQGEDRPLWVNVLAEARTRRMDLRKKENCRIEYTGGNMSSVIRVTTQAGEVAYIKENVKNVPAGQHVEDYIRRFEQSELFRKMESDGIASETAQDYIRQFNDCLEHSPTLQAMFLDNEDFDAEDFQAKENQRAFLDTLLKSDSNLTAEFRSFVLYHSELAEELVGSFGEFFYKHYNARGFALDIVEMDEGSSITNRNVASCRLAELLGISELVPSSQKVHYIDEDGTERDGILMAEAKGKNVAAVNEEMRRKQYGEREEQIQVDDAVYLQLNSLQIFDVIAGQVDRHKGNILLEQEGRHIVKARGIDNDMSFGKLTYEDILRHGKVKELPIKSLENEHGPRLSVIDQKVMDSVLALTDEMTEYVFADLLTDAEMKGLLDRLHGVQKLFEKIKKNKGNVKILNLEDAGNAMAAPSAKWNGAAFLKSEKVVKAGAMDAKYRQKNCYTGYLFGSQK